MIDRFSVGNVLLRGGLALALFARVLMPLHHTHATDPVKTCESKCGSTIILAYNTPLHGHTKIHGCPACFAAQHHSMLAMTADTTLFAHVPSPASTRFYAVTVVYQAADLANPPRAPPAALSIT